MYNKSLRDDSPSNWKVDLVGKAEVVEPNMAESRRPGGGGLGHDEVLVWLETNRGRLAAADVPDTALLLMLVKA